MLRPRLTEVQWYTDSLPGNCKTEIVNVTSTPETDSERHGRDQPGCLAMLYGDRVPIGVERWRDVESMEDRGNVYE